MGLMKSGGWIAICGFLLGATSAVAQPPSPYRSHELDAIMQRLERQETEINALRSQLGAHPSSPFHSTSLHGPNAGAAHGDVPNGASLGPKRVELGGKTVKVGGRILFDNLMFDQEPGHPIADQENRSRFDSARIRVEGDVWENVDYRIEFDFGGSRSSSTDRPTFKDVYMTVRDLPTLGNVRGGYFKEPFSLEQLISSRFTTFMERSVADALVPGRNTGFMAFDYLGDNEDVSWFAGTFRSEVSDDPPDAREDGSDWVATTRVAWNPFYDEPSDGRYLVHLGTGYSYRNIGDGMVRYRVEPELATPDRFLDVTLTADEVNLWNAEAAAQWGPFSVQSEIFYAEVDALAGGDPTYTGAYAYVSYFLTGEHRSYKRDAKAFDRVHVHEPFWRVCTPSGICSGSGAWELAARWSYIDLSEGAALSAGEEGRLEQYTVGVNWYLNDYTRVMFNYVHSQLDERDGDEGDANLFGTRFQVDF